MYSTCVINVISIFTLYMVSLSHPLNQQISILAMATNSTSSSTSPIVELNIAATLPIKLTANNYPIWYKQIFTLLSANNLIGYMNSSIPCPLPLLDQAMQPLRILHFSLGNVRTIMFFLPFWAPAALMPNLLWLLLTLQLMLGRD